MNAKDPRPAYSKLDELKKNNTYWHEHTDTEWKVFEDWVSGMSTKELVEKYNMSFDRVLSIVLYCSATYDHWRVNKLKEAIPT